MTCLQIFSVYLFRETVDSRCISNTSKTDNKESNLYDALDQGTLGGTSISQRY